MNTGTHRSNLPFEEIFSDNYTTNGPTLTSRQQSKKTSQQLLKQKVKNEKETKH